MQLSHMTLLKNSLQAIQGVQRRSSWLQYELLLRMLSCSQRRNLHAPWPRLNIGIANRQLVIADCDPQFRSRQSRELKMTYCDKCQREVDAEREEPSGLL